MEIMYAVIEAVVVSFFLGAVLGGIVVTHLIRKQDVVQTSHTIEHETPEMEPVKIKIDRR